MALSPRQEKRYVSKATIYRTTELGATTYWKVDQDVRCGVAMTSNYSQPKGAILVKEDSVETSDYVHFEAAQDVQGGDFIFIQEGSQQRAGEWFQTTGTPEIHEFRANTRKLFMNGTVPLLPEQIVAQPIAP